MINQFLIIVHLVMYSSISERSLEMLHIYIVNYIYRLMTLTLYMKIMYILALYVKSLYSSK